MRTILSKFNQIFLCLPQLADLLPQLADLLVSLADLLVFLDELPLMASPNGINDYSNSMVRFYEVVPHFLDLVLQLLVLTGQGRQIFSTGRIRSDQVRELTGRIIHKCKSMS